VSLLPLRELKREKVANLLLAFDEKGKRPRLSRKLRATGPPFKRAFFGSEALIGSAGSEKPGSGGRGIPPLAGRSLRVYPCGEQSLKIGPGSVSTTAKPRRKIKSLSL